MKLDARDLDGATVVSIGDSRLDAARSLEFRNALNGLLEGGKTRIVLDLEGVRFMDSSGLGVLVAVLKRLGRGGAIVLCGLGEGVRSLFELTRMDLVFAIEPDVAAALLRLPE